MADTPAKRQMSARLPDDVRVWLRTAAAERETTPNVVLEEAVRAQMADHAPEPSEPAAQ